jgi:hypothetical protein
MNRKKIAHGAIFPLFTIAYALLTGCSYKDNNYTEWVGAFNIDSVTIGAVRMEYNSVYSEFGMSKNTETKNVNFDLCIYSIPEKRTLTTTRLETGLSSTEYAFGSIRFQDPWMAYTCDNGSSQPSLYNIKTKERAVVKDGNYAKAICFSKSCKYLLLSEEGYSVSNVSQKSLTRITQYTYSNPFYIDETTGHVLINFYAAGIKRYNIESGVYDTPLTQEGFDGEFRNVVDYGNAVLVLVNSNRTFQYCTLNDLLAGTIVLHPINITEAIEDIDLKTGNFCSALSKKVKIGNIFNKFGNEIIYSSTKE